MKLGYSNFLQEYVSATNITYDDCRTFQVVCPNCREALFKVSRNAQEIDYLSHYRASKANVQECELRVASIPRKEMQAQNILSRGQHLKLFHGVLKDALLDKAETANWSASILNRTITAMMKRSAYRDLIRWTREQTKEDGVKKIWNDHEREWSEKSPFYQETQLRYAKDMFDYITAPNSFQLLAFGVGLGIVVSMGLLTTTEHKNNKPFHVVVGALIAGSDRDLLRMMRSPEHSALLYSTVLAATMALHSWLVSLPYLDIIKKHIKA